MVDIQPSVPRSARRDTVAALALVNLQRDRHERGHAVRLSRYVGEFARRLGLPAADVQLARRGGLLHDVGKVGIPHAVLDKPGPLRPDELALVQLHTVIGDALCSAAPGLSDVRPIIRHHHERLDGSGYPDGLADDAIPLLAQIVGIVDVYDALTTDRPYRAAWSAERAFLELQRESRRGWRRGDLVEAFIAFARELLALPVAP